MAMRNLLAGAMLSVLAAGPALADGPLDFYFSVTGDASYPGSFTGEIVGLTDNTASQAATEVILDTSSIGFSSPLPFNILSATLSAPAFNSFTVSDGAITDAEFNAFESGVFEIALNYEGTYLFVNPSGDVRSGAEGISGIVFTPASIPVPEPGSLALLAAGLAALAAAAFRRRGAERIPRLGAPARA